MIFLQRAGWVSVTKNWFTRRREDAEKKKGFDRAEAQRRREVVLAARAALSFAAAESERLRQTGRRRPFHNPLAFSAPLRENTLLLYSAPSRLRVKTIFLTVSPTRRPSEGWRLQRLLSRAIIERCQPSLS